MRAIALLALTILVAGCLEAAPEPVQGAKADTAPPPAIATAEPPAPPPPRLLTVPFSYDGATPTFACAPSGPRSCAGVPLASQAGENAWHALQHEGVARSVSFTVTWDAPTPATEVMRVVLVATAPCLDEDEGCEPRVVHEAAGTSPLAVELPQTALLAGEMLEIRVANDDLTRTEAGYLHVGLRQAFSVEGTLVAEVPAIA